MITCQEARNAVTILEVECPQCGEGVEVFVKDGVVCTDSVCTECGNIMTKAAMPLKSAIKSSDPISKEEAITSERCLLYVALTRAKKAAYVFAYGQASEFIS